ncbi:MAG TPA: nickel pincer cofactor biosynthesis protein LarC [Planctomycetota bacterium]|nr:nickel pincer cofactor biosynthesis protein LarC [Planctomycetota bacterium]
MSSHLHFDPVGGIAGDMTVAALVDAGADFAELERRLRASGLPVTGLALDRQWRGGLAGARFAVQAETGAPHRSWRDVRALLEAATLPERARGLALSIFAELAEAEGRVHGCPADEVHFHEVGALDSIVDIVGTALAADLLDVGSASCGAVPVCAGFARGSHGTLPLPAPATAQLLLGFTLLPIEGAIETVTPTGAAILRALCGSRPCGLPPLRLSAVGCGMGSAELPDRPNVLRVLLGQRLAAGAAAPAGAARQDAVVIEAAIDDMDPRLYGAVSERLFAAGALDVALAPLQMKKQRPGTLLIVVARPELEGVLSGIILRETTTLGVRSHDVRRTELERRVEPVETRYGTVRVKLGLLGGEVVNVSAEYDDCARVAALAGAPVKDVLAAAAAAAAEHWSAA